MDSVNTYAQRIVNSFKNFWNYLVNISVSDRVSLDELRYARFTNVSVVLTILGFCIYIPFSLYYGHYLLATLQFADVICVYSVLRINNAGHLKTARIFYLLLINFFILKDACFIGNESRVHEFFYISYVIPFLIFRINDYKSILFGVIIAIIFYNIYQAIYPNFTSYNLSPEIQREVGHINMWMKFVLFGISIYILAYYNYSSETELASANEILNKQAVELKRSNEDLEHFAYVISHDLKAPVRSISGFMKLLLLRSKGDLKKDSLEFVEISKASAERLSQQIDDLLAYCKVGRNLPPTSEVNLNRMIEAIHIDLEQKMAENNAQMIVEQTLPILKDVHPSMVHHIFQNLIANGIKFNTNERPEVKISFTEGRDVYKFSVKDNGIGIDKSQEGRLFQMFNRLHTNEKFEGTGIGLAVCKKIVNFYSGSIWFESEPGNGTTFCFTLPKNFVSPDSDKSSSRPVLTKISKAA